MTKFNKLLEEKLMARMNVNYHNHAASFYANINKAAVIGTLCLSSTAFASLGELLPASLSNYSKEIALCCSAIVAFLNIIVLVLNVQNKILVHDDLRKRWTKIFTSASLLETIEVDSDYKEKLSILRKDVDELHDSEPPSRKIWLDNAYEEACVNLGTPSQKVK